MTDPPRPIIPELPLIDRFWDGKPVSPIVGWQDRYRELRGLDERDAADGHGEDDGE